MFDRELKKKEILEEIKDTELNEISASMIQRKYKIGYPLAQEIYNEFKFIKSNNKVFGYARISTDKQNVGRQIEIFKKEGIDERNIFIDIQTGRTFNRDKYLALKQILRKGDKVKILDLKRFGRNYKENMEQFKEITKDIGADIVALNTPIIDTTQHKDLLGTLVTDIILSVLNYETESDYMQRRIDQKQGIDLWRKTKQTKTGRPYGRPKVERPANWNEIITLVNENKITKTEAMKRLNLKKNKFYEFYNSEKKK